MRDPQAAATGRTATVVGGGVAGMSAACALAEAGMTVRLLERRNYLGGRASSFEHPGVGEVIDNCQHVLFGCCTNLSGFYRRIGVADRIHWTDEMTMIEPGGRRSLLGPSWLPAPFHALPRFLGAHAFTLADKLALGRAFSALMRPVPAGSTETLGAWLARNRQTKGALERFWRVVIASALNADLDSIALPYAAKVIRELFMNSPRRAGWG
jgi:zeta-carotene desaturase